MRSQSDLTPASFAAQTLKVSSVFSITAHVFDSGVYNAESEIQNNFITSSFNLTGLSCVQLRTFTVEAARSTIGYFRANSIILTRSWHAWST